MLGRVAHDGDDDQADEELADADVVGGLGDRPDEDLRHDADGDAGEGEHDHGALDRPRLADVVLLGTNGLDADRGLTTPDQAEADVKEAMVRAARRRIVLADSSKAGEVHLHRFAQLEDLDLVITDEDLDEDHLAELRTDDGPEVVLA